MKQIIVNIDEKGNCSIEGFGFIGNECTKVIDEITDNLGSVTASQNKPEYNQRVIQPNRQQLRN